VRTAVALFTRDLRLHDNPMLRAALDAAEHVHPLFVLDDGIRETRYGAATGRRAFLDDCLTDLDGSLQRIGGALEVVRGDAVAETVQAVRRVGAEAVFVTADVSAYARRRERRLARALDLRLVDGSFVVPPGAVTPAGRDHYEVFSPYHRAWSAESRGAHLPAPRTLRQPKPPRGMRRRPPAGARAGPGGETTGRRRMLAWLRSAAAAYDRMHDDLAGDGTSRLSPYLHFGCVSARELANRASEQGASAFVRQLCWRDFYAQLLWAKPGTQVDDLRPRGDRWVDDTDALDAWKAGLTGYPLVDAGMRQLRAEGWMHNRARLVTASFLVKDLGVDWREGARHFFDLLLDGDVAQNVGNWQWVAGTGVDTRPNRVFNPTAQAKRLDPSGDYVRRWVPELADVPDPLAPGLLAPAYPGPIVDHADAVAAFRARRGG
jgi:deoxyribodipyrimidine photo-lyase